MPIIVNLDVMLAKRKLRLTELSELVGVSVQNLSVLKTGKARAIRFSTLEALCRALACAPGELLEYRSDDQA
jgi:putative transcriptional regulator